MVSRTTIGKSFDGLVRYQFAGRRDQPADKQAEILASSGVSEESAAEMISDFNLGRAVNPKLGYPVWHTSLSFNPADAALLDSAKMQKIAEGYLQKMGLDKTQYVIVRHHDQPNNQHLHIIANRVGYDSKTIDDGRNFYRSKLVLQELIAEYGLTPIQGQRPELQHPERLRGTDLARHEMLTTVNQAVAAETQRSHLLAALRAAGIGVEERFDKAGKATGISFEKDGYKFKGSELGRHLSSEGINKQLAANELKQQAIITVSEATTAFLPSASAALGSISGIMLASAEKVGSVKLVEVPTGQPPVEVSVLATTLVRETAGGGQAGAVDQQATAERDRIQEQAVAAVAAFQREKVLIAGYKDEANQADRRDDVSRMAELMFETIPAAEKRMATYEAEANSTSIGRELLVQQNELQPEKVQKDGSRALEERAAVPAVLESPVITLSTQQPATVPAGNEEIPVVEAALTVTPPVAPHQAVAMPAEEIASSVPALQQSVATEVVTPLLIAKVDDHLQEPVPTANFSERETKGLMVDTYDAAEASQQLPVQLAAPRQSDEEAAKEALAGMRKEQALLEATERDLKLADSAVDIMKVVDLRYRLLPEIAQRLADYRMQAEATPVGRELLAEQDQAQKKEAEQARLAVQEQQKAEEVQAAGQQAAQVAVDGVRRERILLEASRGEAALAEQQGDTGKVRSLREDTIPQAERRLADYLVQAEATVPGRILLAELNEQEKAAQRASEAFGQLAAKGGFISHKEFGQKADQSGYDLLPKLYGQSQQVVEKSSGRQFDAPLVGGRQLEIVVNEAIRVEENARLHQKTEMRKLEIACADYTRYSGKEVVRVRVAEDQADALKERVGSNAIADKEAGSDGRIGISIIYNPSGGASMVSEVIAQVKKSGGEVFEQPEQAARRARSTQAFTSSIAISLGKESDREMGS